MSRTATTMLLAIATILLFSLLHTAYSQAPESSSLAPAAGPSSNDCFTNLLNMSDCLTYVQKGSNLTKPDKGCCPELAGLVESNPICLCQLLGKSDSFGIQIDLNRALKLPDVCKVQTPPVSLCSAIGTPVGAPTANGDSLAPGASSPEGSSASSPGGSEALSPGGSAAPAAAEKGENGALSIARSTPALTVLLAIAFAATFF